MGGGLVLLGIVFWLLLTRYVMPYFANTPDYPYLTWLPFGSTYLENIISVIKNPSLINAIFFTSDKVEYYLIIFGSLGFLSLLSPAHYILFLLPLAKNMFVSITHPGMATITSHYCAHIYPFILISAVCGSGWLCNKVIRNSRNNSRAINNINLFLTLYIILVALFMHGKTFGHKLDKYLSGIKEIRGLEIISYLNKIPQDASVCAVNRLIPHLSNRKYLYIWKDGQGCDYMEVAPEYIVLYEGAMEGMGDRKRIPELIDLYKERGYREVFCDKQNTFFILRNPNIDLDKLKQRPGKFIIPFHGS